MRAGYERLLEVRGANDRLTRQARDLLAGYLRAADRTIEAQRL